MIKLTRRSLLRHLVSASAWLPASLLLAAPIRAQGAKQDLNALGAYLDTLLPADATPSATQLRIDALFLERAANDRELLRLLTLGCAWLDARAGDQGGKTYSELEPSARTEIVRNAESSRPQSLQRVFFRHTRGLAFRLYYSQPAALRGLTYAGPPQPIGFPDQARAPTPAVR